MKVVCSTRFREELGRLERYISERASADVALRFADRMIDELQTLSSSPSATACDPSWDPTSAFFPSSAAIRSPTG